MADNTNEKERLLRALLGEEIGEEEEVGAGEATNLLAKHGITSGDLVSEFREKVEREARGLEESGERVPPAFRGALESLRRASPAAQQKQRAGDIDPATWLDLLLGDAASMNRTGAGRTGYLQSFRGRTAERLVPEDRELIDSLAAEIGADAEQDSSE